MEDFYQRLESLILQFTQKNSDNSYLDKEFSEEQKMEIYTACTAVICQFLYGPREDLNEDFTVKVKKIDQRVRILKNICHPDHLSTASVEIKWLENQFSLGRNNGELCILIDSCADHLKESMNSSEENKGYFDKIKSVISLLESLKKLEGKSFGTQKLLIANITSLIEAMMSYHSDMTKLGGNSLANRVLQTTPYLTSGICLALIIDKLAIFFAATFLLSKTGLMLQRTNLLYSHGLGRQLHLFGISLARVATALMASFVKLNFRLSHGCSCLGIEVVKSVYALMQTNVPSDYYFAKRSNPSNKHLLGGDHFESMELKLVALQLETYRMRSNQLGYRYRLGYEKMGLLEKAIIYLHQIDEDKALSSTEKIRLSKEVLDNLSNHKLFKNKKGHAVDAIKAALIVQQQLDEPRLAIDYKKDEQESETNNKSVHASEL